MNIRSFFITLIVCALSLPAMGQGIVTRNLADPAANSWGPATWNTAMGSAGRSSDVPSENASGTESVLMKVSFSGKGFEYFTITPGTGALPGHVKSVSVWAKVSNDRYSWALKFKDAQGRDQVNGKKLELGFKPAVGDWKRFDFTIPSNWKQPLEFTGVLVHNWNRKQDKKDVSLLIHGLEVSTDCTGVPEDELLKVNITSSNDRNLFPTGQPVRYSVGIDSWLGEELTGDLSYTLTEPSGEVLPTKKDKVTVRGAQQINLDLDAPKMGVYQVALTLEMSNGLKVNKIGRFARIARPHRYTRDEKLISPWGINIHGGMENVAYSSLALNGFTWIRDYAYSKEWTLRAKGDNGKYEGWPWYTKMDQKISDSGLMLLPIYMASIKNAVEQGQLAPDQAWRFDFVDLLMAFPQYPAWELDNEYDLHQSEFEEKLNWAPYRAYHREFAKDVKFINPDALAVENGEAGVHPVRVRNMVLTGDFDDIDVVNAHFYCGTQPPELSRRNANTGQGSAQAALLYDLLRQFVAAADADGKDRQAWVTEFGWDTLAGHIVSEETQAAYSQRGYLLGLQAGLDKMFWYWNRDTKKPPKVFFDGCGIYDPRDEPKPVAAAISSMIHLLKLPKPAGTFDLGNNGFGHLFLDRGRRVAVAFQLDPTGPADTVTFASGSLYDLYGNPLEERTVTLSPAPVWIVEPAADEPFVLETVYDLKTDFYRHATGGDQKTIELSVRNTRDTDLSAQYTLNLPKGWTADPAAGELQVAAGAEAVIPIQITIAAEASGRHAVDVIITEGAATKTLTTEFDIGQLVDIQTEPFDGAPGPAVLKASIKNLSSQVQDFVVQAKVPGNWNISPETQELKQLSPNSVTELSFKLDWNTDWAATDQAYIEVVNTDGRLLGRAGIRVPRQKLARLKKITCDGDLSDWPAKATMPKWLLGGEGTDHADLRLGYTKEGLYLGVEVSDTTVRMSDPTWFWAQEAVELYIDTANNKGFPRKYAPTDHQFWFCPILKDGSVYSGRWKRNDEIPETQYDIQDIVGASAKTDTGYAMEVFIPARLINGFKPVSGRSLGLSLDQSTQGEVSVREAYWPIGKSASVQTHPGRWGTVVLE